MPAATASRRSTVTGQLGDVMKESAQIALSYVRSHARRRSASTPGADQRRFHVHFPAGAVPKDGPSAGVTMTTALVSLLTGRPVRPTVGMTGEVTLQGRVLPIGGVKQKVLAAHRAGLTEVILPGPQRAPTSTTCPRRCGSDMTFHLVDDVADVLDLALSTERPDPVHRTTRPRWRHPQPLPEPAARAPSGRTPLLPDERPAGTPTAPEPHSARARRSGASGPGRRPRHQASGWARKRRKSSRVRPNQLRKISLTSSGDGRLEARVVLAEPAEVDVAGVGPVAHPGGDLPAAGAEQRHGCRRRGWPAGR